MEPGTKDDNKTLKGWGKNIIVNDLMPLLEEPLTKIEYIVVSSFLAKNMTFKELGSQIHLTPRRQKQIIETSIRKIQKFLISIEAKNQELVLLKKEHGKLVIKLRDIEAANKERKKEQEKRNGLLPKTQKLLSKQIEDTTLSKRVKNICTAAGISTVQNLVGLTANDLLKRRNTGKKSIIEIEDFFKVKGLRWRMLE